jgi:membrane protein DedA with SNARE-associated domain
LSFFDSGNLPHLIETYGPLVVGLFVFIESVGIPAPAETALISAAIYAGKTHQLSIAGVLASAAAGAVLGDNLGYWIGRELGYRVVLRYGRHIGLTEQRIKLSQYLFLRYGGKVVFFGRFVVVLRTIAAFFAGVNHMPWRRFLLFNAAGGIVWVTAYGLAAYYFGTTIDRVRGPIGILALVLAAFAVIASIVLLRRHEKNLQAEAERALPEPLRARPTGRPRKIG